MLFQVFVSKQLAKEKKEKKKRHLLPLACALALLLFLSVSDLLPCFSYLFLSAFHLFNFPLYVLFFYKFFFLLLLHFSRYPGVYCFCLATGIVRNRMALFGPDLRTARRFILVLLRPQVTPAMFHLLLSLSSCPAAT
ncbi:hypothetical protein M431DRAFT_194632 [Trichoderma harzianum CBS 226.95]|uniref:Uncharacterized protein n=1 Tax=Trichoderma harzianum CBS 226.95 TaxID=983964 RepID=A0A2T4AUI6_TRIHA|nr:hypothetical protein M431DRAFT_194632 [Trichoderma harzianum CBS 226.95]PTB60724.1 hypothetical protein M431DRAFT_194632 [Trichoderma harzianum CBS 226.95]